MDAQSQRVARWLEETDEEEENDLEDLPSSEDEEDCCLEERHDSESEQESDVGEQIIPDTPSALQPLSESSSDEDVPLANLRIYKSKSASPTVILSPSPQKSIPTTNTISTRPEIDNTSCKRLNQHENINQYYNLEEPYIDGIAPLANEFVLESISNNNHEETITTPILPCSSTSVASANVINLPTPPIASENNKVVAPEIEATVSQPLLVTESNHKPRKRQRNMDMWTKVKIKKLRNIGAQPQKCMREPCAEAEVF
ncbi:unnamed protein product [Parnassius apollo]|uniref:(apollo) hypothetical protein n=1 Tax=Parnassius apollo TaxID=110799 RepID=A0A8S3WC64_PARAO|nr:unnamed protein product [Parnassius apollo]